MKVVCATLLIAFAWPAAAQETRCGWEIGQWVCRVQRPLALPSGPQNHTQNALGGYAAAVEAYEREAAARRAAELHQQQLDARQAQQQQFVADLNTRKRMGELLKNGDCSGAINEALTAGDIKLAGDVKAFCALSENASKP